MAILWASTLPLAFPPPSRTISTANRHDRARPGDPRRHWHLSGGQQATDSDGFAAQQPTALEIPYYRGNCDRGRIPGMAPISFPECGSDDVVLHLYSSRSLGRGLEDLVDGRGRHPWPLLPGRQLRGTLRRRPRSRSRAAARQWDPASWRGGRHYRDRRAACHGVYRRLTALLREAGCRFERQGKGSHEIWFSPITQRTFTVPSNNPESGAGKRDLEAGRSAQRVLKYDPG